MIKELIVVEGKNDAHVVRRALGDVDIIWTEGFGLTKETIDYIAKMSKVRGVIIFTDPDSAGEQIRNRIRKVVPKAKHVYLSKEMARKKQDIGIENANPEEVRRAFQHIQQEKGEIEIDTFNLDDLVKAGLVGKPDAAQKRSDLGRILGIGDANAKQFLHRLNRFQINKNFFWQSVKELADGKSC